jgi:hypothetical protein
MHPFEESMSVAGAVCIAVVAAIIITVLFFRALSWIAGRNAKPESISVRGILGKDTFAAVHMAGGESFDRVRLIGFTKPDMMKNPLPYELNGMVILEDENHQRYLVRAKNIRMIVIPPEAA